MSRQTASRLGAILLLLLAGCAQRTDNFLEQLATDSINQIAAIGSTPAPPPPPPTRAQLDQLPGPMLALGFVDTPGTGFLTAINTTPDGYITYQDRTRRSVILRGGLVSGIQGFRFDLSSVKTQRDDPVVHQTPVANWPATLYRNYQFSQKSIPDFQISVQCRIIPVGRETIIVFEMAHDVMRLQEDCANDQRKFVNLYWADPQTGFIWKSIQWIGPRIQPVMLQVVRPHPASRVAN